MLKQDKNKDGIITFEEVKASVGSKWTKDEEAANLKKFNRMDKNSDGQVGKVELEAFLFNIFCRQ